MTAVQLFQSDEFSLDVELHETDGFHVPASPVARQLGFRETYHLLRTIPQAEKGSTTAGTPNGGQRETFYLTEAGFYRALGMRQASRISDPDARDFVERFQAWVYRDVLPALRRGDLVAKPAPRTLTRRELAQMVIDAEDRAELAEAKAAELAPAAHSWNVLVDGSGDYDLRNAAQILSRDSSIEIGQNRLAEVLRELRWIDTRNRRPYQSQVANGRLAVRIRTWTDPDSGEDRNTFQPRITPKGLEFLHRHLGGTDPLSAQLVLVESAS